MYQIIGDKFIFNRFFNSTFDDQIFDIINEYKCSSIYFSNFDDYSMCLETSNEYVITDIKNTKQKYSYFNKDIIWLPLIITNLIFGASFDKLIENISTTLKSIVFGHSFDNPVDNLPHLLKYLTFGYFFNNPIKNLPCSITHLTFDNYFNESVDYLPNSLTHIKFGSECSK